MFGNICITGITPLDKYPNSKCKKYYKQCLNNIMLCLPDEKPEIECINEIYAKLCVDEYTVLNTILGPKVFVKGRQNIKIIYTANNCQQSLHSAHWEVPFCEFVLIKDICYNECQNILDDVFIGLEHICVNEIEENFINLSLLFIICPKICDFDYCQDCRHHCTDNPRWKG
ncbi:Cna B-type domain-containing protein [[Clostridium] sordellii]|uniref:DUF3794 domain-containing protein n=1 Tax=Paraclostridium sordellii TaxID=1505 RepID=UPI0005E4A86E|nr:DUF3794 domain-containing protein [Paeniclostridium sordellii]CEN75679.1 Cna B-type domain-containing protein [[Clostridium] sordellii] [Paeniclostridium sordellii]